MQLLTNEESARWCEGYGYPLVEGAPAFGKEFPLVARVRYPESAARLLSMAGQVEEHIQPYSTCLVWVTQSGIWPSSENLHLYHVWRRSHGDTRFLFEAPGHWFLDYERTDLVTLLHLALLFAWDVYVVPSPSYGAVFLSHDEFADFYFRSAESRKAFVSRLALAGDKSVQLLP